MKAPEELMLSKSSTQLLLMYSLACFVYQVIEVKSFEMKGALPTYYITEPIFARSTIVLTSAQMILLKPKQSIGSKR